MKIIHTPLFILFFTLGAALPASGQQPVKLSDGTPVYSIEKCIETALENNPSLASSASSLRASKARVWQSASNFLPSVNASGSWSRSRTEIIDDTFEYGNKVNAGVSASMNIFSFGKDYLSLRAQQLSYTSADYTYQNTVNQLVYDVREAYYNLIYAIKSVEVYKASVQQYEDQLKQAQSFFKVGIRSKIDVTNAEVNLNNVKLSLISAENKVMTSYAVLNNLMGLDKIVLYKVDEDLSYQPFALTMPDALDIAYKNRPDLAAAAAKTESSRYSMNINKANYLPDINANASYNVNGSTSLSRENGSVGLSANWALFNGFNTTSKLVESKATYSANQYTEQALRQGVLKEMTQAFATLRQTEQAIPVAELNVEKAKENLDLANGRYKVGIGNSIEVKDAESSFSDAKLQYAKAMVEYQIAKSFIFKSMGGK